MHTAAPTRQPAQTATPFLRLSQGYLLVYSITDDTTFAKLDRVRSEILAQHPRGSRVSIASVGCGGMGC